MATVLSFPRANDRVFVKRQARCMAAYKPEAAANWLTYQLRRQRELMFDRGIEDAKADAQIRALELAIRCEHGRLIQVGGAA